MAEVKHPMTRSVTPDGWEVQIWPGYVLQERQFMPTTVRWSQFQFSVARVLDFYAWIEEHKAELEAIREAESHER